MSITVISNTEKQEAVSAAGDLADGKVEEQESAPTAEADGESTEESDASEEEAKAESDDSDDAEAEDQDDEESESKEEKPKKKGGFKKRIDKLAKRLSERDREVEYLRAETERLRASNAPKKEEVAAKPAAQAEEGRPHPDNYETNAEYVEALTDWKIEQRDKANEVKAKETQVKTEFEAELTKFRQGMKEIKNSAPDYDEVFDGVADVFVPAAHQTIFFDSEFGPKLMYELAKDPKEFARICELPLAAAARAIGRFEAKILDTPVKPETKEFKKTKAPPPIAPVGANSSGSTRKSIYDPNLSQAEYERLRRDQIAKQA